MANGFLEGGAYALPKNFGASGDAPFRSFGLTGRFALPNLEWDGRRNEMGGRDSCRAETTASSEWRVANGEWKGTGDSGTTGPQDNETTGQRTTGLEKR